MSRRGLRRAGTLVVALATGAVACSLLIDKDTVQCKTDADCSARAGATCDTGQHVCVLGSASDAGSDADADAGSDAPTCNGAHPPPAPTGQNAPGAPFVLGVTHVDFGESLDPGGQPSLESLGYDVDGLCTVDTASGGCTPPSWVAAANTKDGPLGRDNVLGRLIYLEGQGMVSTETVSQGYLKGELPLTLLRISGYSGEPEDPEVQVEWLVASSISVAAGTRTATVSTESVPDPDAGAPDGGVPKGLNLDAKAWVTGHVLVATFDNPTMVLHDISLPFTQLTVTAKLEQDPVTKLWSARQGVLAGHTRASNVLGFLPAIMKRVLGITVCLDSVLYPETKTLICKYVDMVTYGAPDLQRQCDALSLALGFDADPITLTGIAPRKEPPVECPTATDPRQDSCIAAP